MAAQAEDGVAGLRQLERERGADVAAAGDEHPHAAAWPALAATRSSAKRAACSQQPFMATPK